MLEECLQAALCWEALHDPETAGQLTAEQTFELARAAGFSKEAAGNAARLRGLERLRNDMPL